MTENSYTTMMELEAELQQNGLNATAKADSRTTMNSAGTGETMETTFSVDVRVTTPAEAETVHELADEHNPTFTGWVNGDNGITSRGEVSEESLKCEAVEGRFRIVLN